MRESEFGLESYGRPKLMRLIRKGVRKFGHTPVYHYVRDFFHPRIQFSVSNTLETQ